MRKPERIYRASYIMTVDRMLSKRGEGAYGLDRREPESTELPEVCAFRRKDGLLDNYLACRGELYVVIDLRFGVIPVCVNHKRLVEKKNEPNQQQQERPDRSNAAGGSTDNPDLDSRTGSPPAGGNE